VPINTVVDATFWKVGHFLATISSHHIVVPKSEKCHISNTTVFMMKGYDTLHWK
jgi:hypothetical protein